AGRSDSLGRPPLKRALLERLLAGLLRTGADALLGCQAHAHLKRCSGSFVQRTDRLGERSTEARDAGLVLLERRGQLELGHFRAELTPQVTHAARALSHPA